MDECGWRWEGAEVGVREGEREEEAVEVMAVLVAVRRGRVSQTRRGRIKWGRTSPDGTVGSSASVLGGSESLFGLFSSCCK